MFRSSTPYLASPFPLGHPYLYINIYSHPYKSVVIYRSSTPYLASPFPLGHPYLIKISSGFVWFVYWNIKENINKIKNKI